MCYIHGEHIYSATVRLGDCNCIYYITMCIMLPYDWLPVRLADASLCVLQCSFQFVFWQLPQHDTDYRPLGGGIAEGHQSKVARL